MKDYKNEWPKFVLGLHNRIELFGETISKIIDSGLLDNGNYIQTSDRLFVISPPNKLYAALYTTSIPSFIAMAKILAGNSGGELYLNDIRCVQIQSYALSIVIYLELPLERYPNLMSEAQEALAKEGITIKIGNMVRMF